MKLALRGHHIRLCNRMFATESIQTQIWRWWLSRTVDPILLTKTLRLDVSTLIPLLPCSRASAFVFLPFSYPLAPFLVSLSARTQDAQQSMVRVAQIYFLVLGIKGSTLKKLALSMNKVKTIACNISYIYAWSLMHKLSLQQLIPLYIQKKSSFHSTTSCFEKISSNKKEQRNMRTR